MKKLQIIGNIGRDAIIKEHNGQSFVSFSVAVNERYKDASGQKVETTDWINCTHYNTKLAQWLTTGKKVFVEGKMKVKVFLSKDGHYKAGINLHAQHLEFVGGEKATNEQAEHKPTPSTVSADTTTERQQPTAISDEDDLPF